MHERLAIDAGVFDGIRWIYPHRPLTSEIERVLRSAYVRGADLWHLACALYVFDEPAVAAASFITLDAQQRHAAKHLGFQ